jgi:DNA-binding NarL/FixJ family response regulator
MDQWNEASWLNRTGPPALRAVAGRSLRVLRRSGMREHAPHHGDHLPGQLDRPLRPAEAIDPAGIRVLVVSDDVLARRGVLAALENQPGMVVVGDRRPGPGVASMVTARHPDVLLLHGLHGSEAKPTVCAARQASNRIRVLTIGARSRDADLQSDEDTCGLLPATATPDEVVAAVRMAAAGYVLSRSTPPCADRPAARTPSVGGPVASGLTGRERDVLALVAKGMSNAEIANELTLSEHTVKSHVQNLLGKLGLRNRIHAVIYAFDTGLARPAGG